MKKEIDLGSPIFSLYIIDDKLIIACGGDPKCGNKNKILLSQISSGYIDSNILCEENLGDNLPKYIEGIPSKKIFGYCTDNQILFYSLTKDGQKFNKIYTMDSFQEKIMIKCFRIDDNLLAVGTEVGGLKLFQINFSGEEINDIIELSSEDEAHSKGINKLEFIYQKKNKLILTASSDGHCKLYMINKNRDNYSLNMVSQFSFRKYITEPANYCMRDMIYSKNDSTVYTLQSPGDGNSFITQWSLKDLNFITPIKTVKVSNNPCPCFDLTEDKKYFGVTETKGKIYFVDAKNLSVTGSKKLGEHMLKHGRIFKNYFITGSIDYILSINKIISGMNICVFKALFYILVFASIGYYAYLKKNNLLKDD